MMTARNRSLVPVDALSRRIHVVRGAKVMLDTDLASVYGVSPKRLNEQVKRNRARFPRDFMFRLNAGEARALRSQNATLNNGRGRHRKYAPYAFTEHGAVMLASILNSSVAVKASILVVRAFVNLRIALGAHRELARKITELENKYDHQFRVVFEVIRQLDGPGRRSPRRRIGFRAPGAVDR
jgi:hypothetical protein